VTKATQSLDLEMNAYLESIDPIIQAGNIIRNNRNGNAMSLLEKAAPLNSFAMQSYNAWKGNWISITLDILPPLDAYHEQRYVPFWTHYYNYEPEAKNYVPYYYKLSPCSDQNLIQESVRMTGVSAGNSSIWVVDRAKVLPTLLVTGCVNNVLDNAVWIGIESIIAAFAITPAAGMAAGVASAVVSCIQGAGVNAIDDYKDYKGHNDAHESSVKCYTSRGHCTDSGVCLTGTTLCDHDSSNDKSDCVIT
jgi:hypothetical protein